ELLVQEIADGGIEQPPSGDGLRSEREDEESGEHAGRIADRGPRGPRLGRSSDASVERAPASIPRVQGTGARRIARLAEPPRPSRMPRAASLLGRSEDVERLLDVRDGEGVAVRDAGRLVVHRRVEGDLAEGDRVVDVDEAPGRDRADLAVADVREAVAD